MKKKIYSAFILFVVLLLSISCLILVSCKSVGKGQQASSEAEYYNSRLNKASDSVNKDIAVEDIFHDQADNFMSPLEPKDTDNVQIRLRVRRGNVTKVTLQFTVDLDKIESNTAKWNDIPMLFEIADETKYFDYYICVIPAQTSPYKYHFKIENNRETVYYNYFELEYGDDEDEGSLLTGGSDYYVMPNFSTPDWAKGCVWYSIMPDTFYNGDTLNDKTTSSVYKEDTWGTQHVTGDYSGGLSYFGGDLMGVENKLEYIKQFGATGVFVNPIWIAYHNAGYGSLDMEQIDSCFGNDNLLTELTTLLHENDMKLMLDGVFTYFSYNGTYYNISKYYPFAGAVSEDDPYYECYIRSATGVDIVWSNPRVNFSSKLTRELVYTLPDSIMQYYILQCGADGWRLDVGGDLQGSDKNNWGTATQIIQDMRRYLKGIDEDVLLCSEGGSGTMLTDYALDTMWNFDYYYCVKDFFEQKTTMATVSNINYNLYNTIMNLPRSVANCSYNFTANHDMPRGMYATGNDLAKVMGMTIVNFTFTGAPCIYFGEEVGMNTSSFFDSMIWDESEYNYEIFNLYKALTALRSEYSEVYKDGCVADIKLDEKLGLLGYTRWKGNQKTVTVMNPFDKVAENITLNVRSLELKDGAKLYDYISGNSYTVKDGKITLSIPKGGVVLVNGYTNGFAGKYVVDRTAENDSNISMSTDGTLNLTGNGVIETNADDIAFANLPAFNNCSVSFDVALGSGEYAVMIRDDNLAKDCAFYSLVLDGTGAGKIVYRAKQGETSQVVTGLHFAAGDRVVVMRQSDNSFCVGTYNGQTLSVDKNTVKYVECDYKVYCGVASINGTSTVKSLKVEYLDRQMSTDFNTASDSMMFAYGNKENLVINDGTLTINGNNELNAYLTGYHMTDFTVKALIKSIATTGYQGIAVWQSENDFVLLGRVVIDGEVKIALGNVINGELSIFAYIDNIDGDITLQLEKIGMCYTGKYSVDGTTFEVVGKNLICNYSEIYAGLVCKDNGNAIFDYFCFGDAINDKHSKADYKTYGLIDYYTDQNFSVGAIVTQSVTGGAWDYCIGGLQQTLESVNAATLMLGGTYKGFKADYTLTMTSKGSEKGYIEYRFGQISGNDSYGVVRLYVSGLVNLLYNDEILAEYSIANFELNKDYRFIIITTKQNMVSVFIGEHPVLIFEREIKEYTQGTQSIVGHKVAFEVTSFNIYHYHTDWLHMSGHLSVPDEKYIIISGSNNEGGNAALLTEGLSDFIVSTNVQLTKSTKNKKSKVGYLLNALSGAKVEDEGILVAISDEGLITVEEHGVVLKNAQAQIDYQSFYMIVAVQNGVINVYIDKYVTGDADRVTNPSTTPVLTYDCGYTLGGSLQLYVLNGKAILSRCYVYALSEGEDYTKLPYFTDRAIDSPIVTTPAKGDAFTEEDASEFSWDFSDKRQIEDFTVYEGAWYIDGEEKCLVGLGTGDWITGLTINKGTFTNYELTYRIKVNVSGAWAGSLLNKDSWKDNHDDGGYLLYTTSTEVNFNQGVSAGSASREADGYVTVKVKVYGNETKKFMLVTIGGTTHTYEIGKDTIYKQYGGYVSFVAGNCVARFKDISIKKLNEDGSYAK